MHFDFTGMSPSDRFNFLTGAVVPRPIAWITTLSATGKCNAAPYTFFSIAGIDPPVVTVTVLPTIDSRMKDTGANILRTQEFVINLVSEELAETMNVTCIDAPPDVSELELAKLETAGSAKIKTPRIERSPVALECVHHSSITLSENQILIVGRVLNAYVRDDLVLERQPPLLDTPRMRLIGGMHGAKWYTRTQDQFAMDRPTWRDWPSASDTKA